MDSGKNIYCYSDIFLIKCFVRYILSHIYIFYMRTFVKGTGDDQWQLSMWYVMNNSNSSAIDAVSIDGSGRSKNTSDSY